MEVNLTDYYERQSGNRKMYHGGHVVFFMDLVPDLRATEEKGRPVVKEVPSVRVKFPGCDETVVPISEQHMREYPEQYAAFMKNQEQPTEGTALEAWPMMSRPIVEELKHFGFRTIEQLAAGTDEARRKLGPLGTWVKKAKEYVKAAESGPNEVVKLKEQLESSQAKNRKLEDQVELLIRRVESLEGNRFDGGRRELNDAT